MQGQYGTYDWGDYEPYDEDNGFGTLTVVVAVLALAPVGVLLLMRCRNRGSNSQRKAVESGWVPPR